MREGKASVSYEYEDRWVAFIDILGFKEHVIQLNDEEKRARLIDAVSGLNGSSQYYCWRAGVLGFTEKLKATTFSDNIVISGAHFELQYVLEMAGVLCRELVAQGYMPRGAIAKGRLCHQDDLVIGVGLVEAYKLESEVAIYPRVILQDKYVDEVIEKRIHNGLLTTFGFLEDFDGMYYLDYLDKNSESKAVDPSKMLEAMELALSSGSQRVRAKAHWMKKYLERHSLI